MSDDEGELLAAMGLTDSCPLKICRKGEPCIVRVGFTRLALSGAIARNVMVVPSPATPGASPSATIGGTPGPGQ